MLIKYIVILLDVKLMYKEQILYQRGGGGALRSTPLHLSELKMG